MKLKIHKATMLSENDGLPATTVQLLLDVNLGSSPTVESMSRELHDIKALVRSLQYLLDELQEANPFDGPLGAKKLNGFQSTLEKIVPYMHNIKFLAEQIDLD